MRRGFTMIEMVFVVVILGVLAAVAVPKFVATRTDKRVATLRSDTANTLKTIVAKVFADNLNTTNELAPHPTDRTKTPSIYWNRWIIEVSGLSNFKWLPAKNDAKNRGISPAYKVGKQNIPCGEEPYIQITDDGDLYFNPRGAAKGKTGEGLGIGNEYLVCQKLRDSYQSSAGYGNKIIPLTSTNTISF
ncbi:type II secretion system protein [Helicobacter sp. 23-1045]